jgi:hypothetical protein
MTEDDAADVAFVYQQQDAAWALWLADALVERGLSVAGGWETQVDNTPRYPSPARVLVVLASDDIGSASFIWEAIRHAQTSGTLMLPVRLSDHADLRGIVRGRALDFSKLSRDEAAERLYRAVERRLHPVLRSVGRSKSRAVSEGALLLPSDASPSRRDVFKRTPGAVGIDNELSTFVNRADELARMHDLLIDRPSRKPVVLSGPSGIGKTALARTFASRTLDHWRDVIWLAHPSARQISAVVRSRAGDMSDVGPTLAVIDDPGPGIGDDLGALIENAGEITWIIISRDRTLTATWPVISLSRLSDEQSIALLQRIVSNLSSDELGALATRSEGIPLVLRLMGDAMRGKSVSQFIEEIDAFTEVVRHAPGNEGVYFLDTDDPRAISAFERALSNALGSVELGTPKRGSWLRPFRQRYVGEHGQAAFDKAERAIEVQGLAKPEGEANVSYAEASARLLEASAPIPNIVLLSGSILLIKVTNGDGVVNVLMKSLTATELRRLDGNQGALTSPVEALEFLRSIRPSGQPDALLPPN